MGRLEDIEKRNKKSLAVMNAIEAGTNLVQGTPGWSSDPSATRVPSQAFTRYLAYGLVVAFVVLVVLAVAF